MYAVAPPYVILLDEVWQDPLTAARAARLLAALPPDTPCADCRRDQIADVAQMFGWHYNRRMGMPPPARDPGLFLGLMRFDDAWPATWQAIRATWPRAPYSLKPAHGYDAFAWFDSHHSATRPQQDHVCRPAWRLHLTYGCPHKCFYCGLHEPWCAMLNVEEVVAQLDRMSRLNPWQTTWLYEDDAEALALEPEYGGLPALLEWAAGTPDQHIIVHTKSANVGWLQDRPHRGRTILVWSLTGPTQSTVMEPGSGTWLERLEAARLAQSWGYPVRFKLKPIVPVVGWQAEMATLIEHLFAAVQPDLISLFTLAWMDYQELVAAADTSLLDPRFLAGAAAAADELKGVRVRPFPHDLRREVYEFCIREIRRYSAEVPISLCTESLPMWQELGPALGYRPGDYPCGCGPQATPGLVRLSSSPWRIARPVHLDGSPVAV
ncbi:MAG: hypothetical protein IT204_24405 [Fimbriimonadaceae bacterium]|nr:hypothetical protein [Fimbriimonadaceae bacterium]